MEYVPLCLCLGKEEILDLLFKKKVNYLWMFIILIEDYQIDNR